MSKSKYNHEERARLRIAAMVGPEKYPYFATVFFGMGARATPEIPTMGVDAKGRLYLNPSTLDEYSREEFESVIVHETWHILLRHFSRGLVFFGNQKALTENAKLWNIACDMEIHGGQMVDRYVFPLPGDYVCPKKRGWPTGKTAEWYARKLQEEEEAPPPPLCGCPACGAPASALVIRAGPRPGIGLLVCTACGFEQEVELTEDKQSPKGEGIRREDSDPDNGEKDDDDDDDGDSDGSDNKPGNKPDNGSGNKPGEDQTGGGDLKEGGSSVDGNQRPWEDDISDGGEGFSREEKEELQRQKVIEDMKQHKSSESRGSMPGGFDRWLEDALRPPTVPWQQRLESLIRRATVSCRGQTHETYARTSHLSAVLGVAFGRTPILPGLGSPEVDAAIVVDTSGSMGGGLLASALTEVEGILRVCGGNTATVLSVDAAVHECKKVFSAKQVVAAGGGGTDMRIGIDAALKTRPRPNIVVVLTDGYTPWPKKKEGRYELVVGIVGNCHDYVRRKVPNWAHIVEIS